MLALLLGLDHSERVVAIRDPLLRVIYVQVPKALTLAEEPVASHLPRHRVFRLSLFRSRDHRWMRVYNEGRTQTPEDGYVYLEQARG